jgi:phage gpG-like protein
LCHELIKEIKAAQATTKEKGSVTNLSSNLNSINAKNFQQNMLPKPIRITVRTHGQILTTASIGLKSNLYWLTEIRK